LALGVHHHVGAAQRYAAYAGNEGTGLNALGPDADGLVVARGADIPDIDIAAAGGQIRSCREPDRGVISTGGIVVEGTPADAYLAGAGGVLVERERSGGGVIRRVIVVQRLPSGGGVHFAGAAGVERQVAVGSVVTPGRVVEQ